MSVAEKMNGTAYRRKVSSRLKKNKVLEWDEIVLKYRGADKSSARPDWKKQLKVRHFSSDAEVIDAAETWLDGKTFWFVF